MNTLTRGAVFGAACALCAILAAGSAAAQTYPPGTNCQSLLPSLRAGCMGQVQQLNSGVGNSTVVPNSAGSNTVTTPGANSVNSGTTVTPGVAPSGVAPTGVGTNGTIVTPNGTSGPSGTNTNGVLSPNAVTPNGTVSPNAVTPTVRMPGTANPSPTGTPVIIPPANTTGTGAAGAPGTSGTGTGAGGTGTSGN